MKSLSSRERKLVAIGVLIALLALGWLGVIQPIINGFSERAARREALVMQYSQNLRLIARIELLRRAAEDQRKRSGAYAIFAPSAEQASERLKERLEASLIKAGGELRSTESVDTRQGWVQANAAATVSNDQLVRWLGLLGTDEPYLAMESLTVAADRALNSNRPDIMDVKIEVSIPLGDTDRR